MSKGMAMRKLGSLVTLTIMIGVGLQMINSLNSDINESMRLEPVYPDINYPYCSDFNTGERINRQEFSKLLFYRLKGNCEIIEQRTTLDFVLENKTIAEELRRIGLYDSDGDLYLYNRKNCSSARDLSLKGVKVGKNNQRILFQKGEELTLRGTDGEVTIC